jgi:LTXXQ motif family protein
MLHLGICRTTALALASSMTLLGLSPAAAAEGIDDAGSPAARVDAAPAAPAQKPTDEESPNRPSFDPVSERIKYLHDRLRITRAQEPLWDNVAQVMRENADAVAPLVKERVQFGQRGNAIEILNSYKNLGQAQLEGLQKFIDAFRALYEQLSDQQKKIADSVFRLGPMGMVGGIPQLAEQFVSPPVTSPAYPVVQAYPPYPTYSVYPSYPYYPFYSYAYVPTYNPWIWRPPVGLGVPFFFAHRHFFHRHGFGHSAAGGVPHSHVGVMHHR